MRKKTRDLPCNWQATKDMFTKSTTEYASRPNWAAQPPLPHNGKGGGGTRLRVRGPNLDDWRKSLALCLLCEAGMLSIYQRNIQGLKITGSSSSNSERNGQTFEHSFSFEWKRRWNRLVHTRVAENASFVKSNPLRSGIKSTKPSLDKSSFCISNDTLFLLVPNPDLISRKNRSINCSF